MEDDGASGEGPTLRVMSRLHISCVGGGGEARQRLFHVTQSEARRLISEVQEEESRDSRDQWRDRRDGDGEGTPETLGVSSTS